MSGSGGGNQSSQTTNSPWGPVIPYAKKYMQAVFDQFQQGQGNNPFPSMGFAGLNADQTAAFDKINGMGSQITGMNNANNAMATDTINGKYLDPSTNPWLAKTADAAGKNLIDQYQTATAPGIAGNFLSGGGYGSSAMTSAEDQARYSLGNNLTQLDTSIYGGNYNAERGNQLQMSGMMPALDQANYLPAEAQLAVGGQEQQNQQNQFNTNYQNAYQKAQFPYSNLDFLGSMIGSMGGMGGKSSVQMPNMGKGL